MLNPIASPLVALWFLLQRPATRAALVLVVLVLASAIAVVHASHKTRTLFGELEALRLGHDDLLERQGRLLLERSTFSAYSRVERLASEELGMHIPELDDTRRVQP